MLGGRGQVPREGWVEGAGQGSGCRRGEDPLGLGQRALSPFRPPPGRALSPRWGQGVLDDGSQRPPCGSGCGAALGLNRSPGAPIDGGPCAARAACDE